MTEQTPSSDTTKIIPPPRRGTRPIDLVLAAAAGSLVTIVAFLLMYLGNQPAQVLPATSSSSPSASAAASTSPLATVRGGAPTAAAPTNTPVATAATTAAPTAPPAATATPRATTTPAPTAAPSTAPTVGPTKTP